MDDKIGNTEIIKETRMVGRDDTDSVSFGGLIELETLEIRLNNRRDNLQRSVYEIDAALAILAEQPKLVETINLFRRIGIW